MSGFRLEGNTSGNVQEVDSSNNAQVNTPGYTAAGVSRGGGPSEAGAVMLYTENDSGSVTGAKSAKAPKTSLNRRLRVGLDTLLFNDTFNATTQNTNLWAYTFATMTASQPGAGTVNFGTVQGTAATHGAFMRSFQYFPVIGKASLAVKFTMGLFTATLAANEEWRCGFALPTVAGTAPTDGVWLKLTTAGLIGEAQFNGVSAVTTTIATLASFTLGILFTVEIIIGEDGVEFWRSGILLGTLANAVSNGQPFQDATLPLFMQKLCTGVVTNTNTVRVSDINVYIHDIASNKNWEAQLSTLGQSGNIGQNGQTQGKASLWGNGAAPTAAASSNTTPPFSGLGGIVAILPTTAVSTDGIVQSYTNPASTINMSGRNLLVYAVKVDSHVSVAFTGGPLAIEYFIAYGHTADSLATAETGSFITATTHAPKIVPLGVECYPATAAVATKATGAGQPIEKQFRVPLIIRPGERFALCYRLGVGSTVTSAGAVTMLISVDAVFE